MLNVMLCLAGTLIFVRFSDFQTFSRSDICVFAFVDALIFLLSHLAQDLHVAVASTVASIIQWAVELCHNGTR